MPKYLPEEEKVIPKETLEIPQASEPNEKRQYKLFNYFTQFFIVAVLFFGIGFVVGQKKVTIDKKGIVPTLSVTNQAAPKNINVDFSLFWQVYETLPQKYLDKSAIDGQKILHGAIAGMVKSLGDPYTSFLDPKQNESTRSQISGSFEGIGIQLGFDKDKRLAVIAPLKGTPADAAGVKSKDLIIKINDKEAYDMSLPEAVDLIRGKAGTKVKLQFFRDGVTKPFEKEIERAKIEVKTVSVEFMENKGKDVAVISVSMFGEKTDSEWDSAVAEVNNHGVGGIVVDMRNNPGGLLSSSVHLAAEFVTGTVVKQEFADGTIAPLPTEHAGAFMKIPLVVLVNGGSASAAEIFAGAMQDNKRGKIVGEKTFGKGTVQDVLDLPGGSGLHVTIARWLTPKGNSIHHVGITPDVVVESQDQDLIDKKDFQLEKALELL